MSAWGDLERQYRVPQPHIQLVQVGSAILGSYPFGRMRNLLWIGADPNGLLLQKWWMFGSGTTLYIPWSHIRRGSPPTFPFAAYPRETLLLGPQMIPLTIPQGYIRAPF